MLTIILSETLVFDEVDFGLLTKGSLLFNPAADNDALDDDTEDNEDVGEDCIGIPFAFAPATPDAEIAAEDVGDMANEGAPLTAAATPLITAASWDDTVGGELPL